MAHISKSAFVKGVQCAKQLYLYKNNYSQRDPLSADEQVRFKRGVDVGVLAQKLFPNGKDLSPQSPWAYKQATAITRHFLEQGEKHVYEASFLYNGLYAIMDIVVNDNGTLKLYEVKNTRSVKEQHIVDASFQYYVITQSGFKVDSVAIIYPNRSLDDYEDAMPLTELFEVEDITERIVAQQLSIALQTEYFIGMVGEANPPAIDIGNQCFRPYACGFMHTCWANAHKADVEAVVGDNLNYQEILLQKNIGL